MLKIVYPVCCGMDVHKSFVVACIASTNDHGVTTYRSGRFSTFTGDLRRLATWLHAHSCTDVCMESTGKYWIPIYNILESSCRITLAHPKYVKAIRGKKTDKKDAKWIADIFKHGLVCGSFIPPADIRQLRDLMRYRAKLTGFSTGEKNRAQNCLTVSNIKLDDVFSDVFGKTASAITQRLLENDAPFDVTPFLNKKLKASLLLGWSYAAEQRECRKEKDNAHQQSRGIHQTASCPVCPMRYSQEKQSRDSQPIPESEETARSQEGDYCDCTYALDCDLQHHQEEREVQSRALPQGRYSSEESRGFCKRSHLYLAETGVLGDCPTICLIYSHRRFSVTQ